MSYEIDKWSALLLGQPETGMGYQIVEVTLPQGAEHVVVLNARRALENQESPRRFREGANLARKMRVELMLSSKREDTPYRVLKLREAVTKGLVESGIRGRQGAGFRSHPGAVPCGRGVPAVLRVPRRCPHQPGGRLGACRYLRHDAKRRRTREDRKRCGGAIRSAES